jgi:hypothetical protein
MTGMDNRRDILVAVLMISLCSVFILGMVYWPMFKKDGTWIGTLYYVTVASVLYFCGVVFNILATTKCVKRASFTVMGVFSWNLYVELFLDATNWSNIDLGLLIFVTLNTTLAGFIIERLKTKKK